MMIFGFNLFQHHLECKICGKQGFLMDSKNDVYCKHHSNLEVKPTDLMDCDV